MLTSSKISWLIGKSVPWPNRTASGLGRAYSANLLKEGEETETIENNAEAARSFAQADPGRWDQ